MAIVEAIFIMVMVICEKLRFMIQKAICMILINAFVLYSQEYCQLGKRFFVSVVDSLPAHNVDTLSEIARNYDMKPFPKLSSDLKLGLMNRKASFGFAYSETMKHAHNSIIRGGAVVSSAHPALVK